MWVLEFQNGPIPKWFLNYAHKHWKTGFEKIVFFLHWSVFRLRGLVYSLCVSSVSPSSEQPPFVSTDTLKRLNNLYLFILTNLLCCYTKVDVLLNEVLYYCACQTKSFNDRLAWVACCESRSISFFNLLFSIENNTVYQLSEKKIWREKAGKRIENRILGYGKVLELHS